jgi:hypothetical protein
MAEMMTLEMVRDRLREAHDFPSGKLHTTIHISHFTAWADAIDAHLTQPAQAVDVGAIREVIREVIKELRGTGLPSRPKTADKLTRAIGNAQAEGWRPIETAPKDGTRVMLGNELATWEAEYRPVYSSGYRPENPWFSVMLNMDHLPRERRYGSPTHWQPLPTPPQPEE